MSNAQVAYSSAYFEHSLELKNSELALSKANFPTLFKRNPEQATATVLVSYFSAIDNCESLSDYPKAQLLFNSTLHFLHSEKVKKGHTIKQRTALLRGVSQVYKEWCEFIHTHNAHLPKAEQDAFQQSINNLSSFRHSESHLH